MSIPLKRISELQLSSDILDNDLIILNKNTTETKSVTVALLKNQLSVKSIIHINQNPPPIQETNNLWIKPEDKELRYFDSTQWQLVLKDVTKSSLLDHADTVPSAAVNNSTLIWNQTQQKWVVSSTPVMLRNTYDSDGTGIVDNSERLGGNLPTHYLNRSNHTGSLNTSVLTSTNATAGNFLRWDGATWGPYPVKLSELADVLISSFPNNSNNFIAWDNIQGRFILKAVTSDGSGGHIIQYNNSPLPARSLLEFTGILVTVTDNQLDDKTTVNLSLPNTVVLKSQIDPDGDGIVDLAEIANVANSVTWSNVTGKPTIPSKLDDFTDVTLEPAPTNSDTGKALVWNGTQFVIGIPIDERPGHQIFNNSVAVSPRLKLNIRGPGVEIYDDAINQWTDILITGVSESSMSKAIYDPDDDGSVLLADKIKTADAAPNTSYYGKDSNGSIGFHSLPGSNVYLTKGIYDTTNNGIVDNSEALAGQTPSYYLARGNHTGSQPLSTISQSGASVNQVPRWNGTNWVPAVGGTGDMLASLYDNNSDGIVNSADMVNGISSANNNTYYGKNAAGAIGFHSLPSLEGTGDMLASVYDTNNDGTVDNSERLNGQTATFYRNRDNHTGTQLSNTISDFAEAVDDRVDILLVNSATISKSYADNINQLSLNVIGNTSTQKVEIYRSGVYINARKTLNFIPGANVTLAVVDNSSNDRVDVTISASSGSVTDSFNTYTKAQVVQSIALTEASTINTDASLSNSFTVTLTANRILANPTNLISGGTYNWLVTQDATGGRVLTLGNLFILAAGSTFATTSNAKNVLSCIFIGGFLYCSIAKF